MQKSASETIKLFFNTTSNKHLKRYESALSKVNYNRNGGNYCQYFYACFSNKCF